MGAEPGVADRGTDPLSAATTDPWATTLLMCCAAVVLGLGTVLPDRDVATVFAIASAVIGTGALFMARHRFLRAATERSAAGVATVAIGMWLLLGLLGSPMRDMLPLLGQALIATLFLLASRAERLRMPAVVTAASIHLVWLAALIGTSVPLNMDVYMFQQEAAAAVMGGHNPYELRYPNIYGEETSFYSPEVMENGFLSFGFPYPPVSLMLALPAYALGGDYRFALAAAVTLTAIVIACLRRGPVGPLIAGLFLTSPMTIRVVANGWTEPFVGLLAALVALAAARRLKVTPLVLGLLVAVKQYVFPIVILAVALLPRRDGSRRYATGVIALGVAALTIVPALLRDPDSFLYSAGLVQILQPFRTDSVSIPGFIARLGGPELPAFVAFAALLLSAALLALYTPRTLVGFLGASTIMFTVFFLASKQAFVNYYFFSFTLMALTAAAASGARSQWGPATYPSRPPSSKTSGTSAP